MTLIRTTRVHAVKQVPYSNRYDVVMVGGPLNFPQVKEQIEVFAKYVGGGRSIASVTVPIMSVPGIAEPFPYLSIPAMDGIARRIDGRYRKISDDTFEKYGQTYYVRNYAFNAND
jgi:hypothetical protein